MTDEDLRRLRRTWQATGDPLALERYQRELDRHDPPLVAMSVAANEAGIEDGALALEEALGHFADRLSETDRFGYLSGVREALMNAVHHGGKAGQPVLLELRVREARLEATVTDAGPGFDHRRYTTWHASWAPVQGVRGQSPPGIQPDSGSS